MEDTTTTQLTIHISGGPLPAQLGAGELGELLQSIEQSLLSIVKRDNPENFGDHKLALVAIKAGSVTLDFSLPPHFVPAVSLLGSRLNSGNISDLPEKCRRSILWLGKWCRTRTITLDWFLGKDKIGSITPSLDLSFEAAPQIKGSTVLSGMIHLVGGERPSFKLRLTSGELLVCTCGDDTARQAGRYLYRKVTVEGFAQNNVMTGEMTSFEARMVSLVDRKLADGFAAIRKQFGSAFDTVDVAQFMNQVRGEQLQRIADSHLATKAMPPIEQQELGI